MPRRYHAKVKRGVFKYVLRARRKKRPRRNPKQIFRSPFRKVTAVNQANCKTCQHPARSLIELALIRGVSTKQVQKRFSSGVALLSLDSIRRHRRNHMPPELKAAVLAHAGGRVTPFDRERLEEEESANLLLNVAAQRSRIWSAINVAEDRGKLQIAAQFHKNLHNNLSLTARLLGELRTGAQSVTNNLIVAPEYLQLRTALMHALDKFPDARRAVSQVLMDIEKPDPKLIEHHEAISQKGSWDIPERGLGVENVNEIDDEPSA